MERNGDSRKAPKTIENVAGSASWFRDTPHYWASDSLRFAYAVACIEVVCKSSERARILYNRIVEAWSDDELKAFFDEVASIIPESEMEKIKNALLNPETELLPDPNKADLYLLTTARTWGCLIVVNVASNGEPSVSILPCAVS